MSLAYDTHLKEHKQNVKRGYDWFKDFLPELITTAGDGLQYLIDNHDYSKNNADEYAAYDNYFYGGNKSYDVKTAFDFAWLLHIHRNPHHWQFWVLQGDDDGVTPLEMPYEYIIEMICDWWSFSWATGNLFLIFDWYNDHKNIMLLNPQNQNNCRKYIITTENQTLMMTLLAHKNSSLYYERKLILMDKCEKVIIRRPVSEEAIAKANKSLELINKTCALLILGESCGLEPATVNDMKFAAGALLDVTATLAGFKNPYDMTDYLKIYGKL